MGRNLAHFSWLARLKRQILVLSENSDLAVVGGSFRNQTGHWRAGCFQTELKNSVLRYTEGYYTSYEECMYCDYLGGAFVARTSIMKEITLDEQLNHETVFEDWILRLNNKNNLAMSCPDAMYFTGMSNDSIVYAKLFSLFLSGANSCPRHWLLLLFILIFEVV